MWLFIPEIRHSWECGVTNIMWAWLSLCISFQLMQTQLMLILHSKCKHWPVDGNSQPWDWFPVVLLRWFFFYFRSPSLPGLLQQSAGLHAAVIQLRPTPSPRQARGALYLPVHLRYWCLVSLAKAPLYCLQKTVPHICSYPFMGISMDVTTGWVFMW